MIVSGRELAAQNPELSQACFAIDTAGRNAGEFFEGISCSFVISQLEQRVAQHGEGKSLVGRDFTELGSGVPGSGKLMGGELDPSEHSQAIIVQLWNTDRRGASSPPPCFLAVGVVAGDPQ